MIVAARTLCETVHHVLHDGGACPVIRVASFARLEKNIWILGRPAQDGTVRGQGALAVLAYELVIDEGMKVVIAQGINHVDFVRGAEAVKEMQEGHARFQRSGL